MPRTVFIGADSFETIRTRNYFYVDKTDFIRQWWDHGSLVTAIMRPRRFGKTLTMDMVECFFSTKYAGRSELFEGLSIWDEEHFRALQGTYPVLFLSFAEVKDATFEEAKENICTLIWNLYNQNRFLLDSDILNEDEKNQFRNVCRDMQSRTAIDSLRYLMDYLSRYYGKKVIVLLDEYDTPLQEAYMKGYWEQLVAFLRPLFGTTFKGNPYLERGLMTGITRIAKESIFSDLNNLKVITTTSEQYADCFGFTQEEVDAALEEYGLSDRADAVKAWYDGFTFGNMAHIYNPWSITNFLDDKKLQIYWANVSSNSLIGQLIRQSSNDIKMDCEKLLAGENIDKTIDEEIVFSQIGKKKNAIWSFLLASGYLKVVNPVKFDADRNASPVYRLALTNREILMTFWDLITDWFSQSDADGDEFFHALIKGDLPEMNRIINDMTREMFSFFDTGGSANSAPENRPERFYHAFVLGLIAYSRNQYHITSNRESGQGRYDVVMEPKDMEQGDAILIEFKVLDKKKEKSLEETVQRALKQIEEKEYSRGLLDRGFPPDQIRKYGFAFDGKKVLIGC